MSLKSTPPSDVHTHSPKMLNSDDKSHYSRGFLRCCYVGQNLAKKTKTKKPCLQITAVNNENISVLEIVHSTSINQSNFYSANIPGEARLSGATAKSVFNSKIEETVP